MTDKIKKGKAGEEAAAQFLVDKGYQIIARNFRFRRAEVDLIAQKDNWLIFVEVKARTSNAFGHPESFVDQHKIANVLMAADEYVHQQKWQGQVRYDVISIEWKSGRTDIVHFEDAFY